MSTYLFFCKKCNKTHKSDSWDPEGYNLCPNCSDMLRSLKVTDEQWAGMSNAQRIAVLKREIVSDVPMPSGYTRTARTVVKKEAPVKKAETVVGMPNVKRVEAKSDYDWDYEVEDVETEEDTATGEPEVIDESVTSEEPDVTDGSATDDEDGVTEGNSDGESTVDTVTEDESAEDDSAEDDSNSEAMDESTDNSGTRQEDEGEDEIAAGWVHSAVGANKNDDNTSTEPVKESAEPAQSPVKRGNVKTVGANGKVKKIVGTAKSVTAKSEPVSVSDDDLKDKNTPIDLSENKKPGIGLFSAKNSRILIIILGVVFIGMLIAFVFVKVLFAKDSLPKENEQTAISSMAVVDVGSDASAVEASASESGQAGDTLDDKSADADEIDDSSEDGEDITEDGEEAPAEDSAESAENADSDENRAALSVDTVRSLIDIQLSDQYAGNYTLDMDDESVTVCVWADGAAKEVNEAIKGVQRYKDDWIGAKNGIMITCDKVSDILSENGYDDFPVVVNFLNDQNKENTFLTVINGEIFYDIMENQ